MLLNVHTFDIAFWLKENSYWEQPLVIHNQQSMIYVEGLDEGVPFHINYGTDLNYQLMMESSTRSVALRVFPLI